MATKVKEEPKILEDRSCEICGQLMTEIAFNTSAYACFCDNDKCEAFRRPYYSRNRDNSHPVIKNSNRILQPGYQNWLKRKRNTYHYARDLGLRPKQAGRLADTPWEEIAKIAEEELCLKQNTRKP